MRLLRGSRGLTDELTRRVSRTRDQRAPSVSSSSFRTASSTSSKFSAVSHSSHRIRARPGGLPRTPPPANPRGARRASAASSRGSSGRSHSWDRSAPRASPLSSSTAHSQNSIVWDGFRRAQCRQLQRSGSWTVIRAARRSSATIDSGTPRRVTCPSDAGKTRNGRPWLRRTRPRPPWAAPDRPPRQHPQGSVSSASSVMERRRDRLCNRAEILIVPGTAIRPACKESLPVVKTTHACALIASDSGTSRSRSGVRR